jgi:serine/threonine protein kinase
MSPLSDADLAHLRSVLPDSEPRYRLLEPIGSGGMGVVWRAHDTRLRRDVALKVLARSQPDADAEARLTREAAILARLEHPGIVPVHDTGRLDDGRLYYVMKLVRGRPLADALDATTSAGQRVAILMRIAEALAFAHKAGVIHRDLKPSNVMVGDFGEVLVLDWGVAGWLGERADQDAPMPPIAGASSTSPVTTIDSTAPTLPAGRTATGTVLGTPGWMSPEQARGHVAQTDARTDVWGLGALLVWSFSGRAPEVGATGEIPLPPALPRPLGSIASRALAVDPADRYPGADAVLADLRAWRDGDRVAAHRESPTERIGRFIARYRVPILLTGAYILARIAIYLWGRV